MTTIYQFENNLEEDEFYLVEIYWFITNTLVEPSINQLVYVFSLSYYKSPYFVIKRMSLHLPAIIIPHNKKKEGNSAAAAS